MRNLSPLTSGFVVIIEEVANHSACILSYVDPCFIFVINTQIGTFLELLYRPDLFIRYLFSYFLAFINVEQTRSYCYRFPSSYWGCN